MRNRSPFSNAIGFLWMRLLRRFSPPAISIEARSTPSSQSTRSSPLPRQSLPSSRGPSHRRSRTATPRSRIPCSGDLAMHNRKEETMQTDANEELAKQLEATGDYRVLRRLVPHPASLRPESCARIGIAIDVETTGLDVARDEVIELAMVKFAYSADDRVIGVVDVFQAFQQPSHPIAPEIVELTGITDAM